MREGERRVLGRGNSCDYAIADPTVSMRHAELLRVDGGWRIRDLDSLNGTRVNGWLVKQQRLQRGDTLALGGVCFRFEPLE
jgi:pSer/pThr/pTyr-binding forkhead associated (FHA) protein